MIPSAPLWPPTTTPIAQGVSRRHLRPRPFTLALGVLAAVSALLFLATGAAAQLAVSGAVWSAIVIDAVIARRSLGEIDVSLSSEPLLTTVDPMRCTVRVTGPRRAVTLTPSVRPTVQRFLVEGPQPGIVVLAPRRRGVVHTLLIDASTNGPIGLMECARRVRVRLSPSVVVGPAPLPHDVDWPRPRAISFGPLEATPVGDDLYRSVRPYVRGDSRRRVHWPATAHHGTLMVRESDGTGVVLLRIVVQLDTPGAASEAALARAAWVARSAIARGWRTELVTMQPRQPPVGIASPLGSPFAAPPLDIAAAAGPVHVVSRRVSSERDVIAVLATAMYGPITESTNAGFTYLVTTAGDRWR